jgi:hypothetical protein
MINFYKFYNKTGLDHKEYSNPIAQLLDCKYSSKLKPIEHIIKKNPEYAYYYAKDVKQCRWLEAEPYIKPNEWYLYLYACDVVKVRWFEMEPCIKKDPALAYKYAVRVIKSRWSEAEPYIKQSTVFWAAYRRYFKL